MTNAPGHPASFAQQRLWFLSQYAPNSAAYNNANAVHIRGHLEVTKLRQALMALHTRHAPLQCRFVESPDGLRAVPVETREVPLPCEDVTATNTDTAIEHAKTRARKFASDPIDLAVGPAARWLLLRLSDNEHLLVYVVHHAVSDRWSLGVLIRELALLLDNPAVVATQVLGELPISFAAHAAREQAGADERSNGNALKYWLDQVGSSPPILDLHTDHPRPANQRYLGERLTVELGTQRTTQLEQLAKKLRASPFMLLCSAFQALLARASGQADFVLGTFVAGRTQTETEGLVGLFVNTIALRADLTGNPAFEQIVANTRTTLLRSHRHHGLPFEQLVDELSLPRDPSRPPLVPIIFNFHNVPMTLPDVERLQLELLEIDTGTSRFDLTLTMRREPGGLIATWEYNSDLFEAGSIRDMSAHFVSLLDDVVTEPTRSLGSLRLQALDARGTADEVAVETATPKHASVLNWVRAVAAETPRAPAVRYKDRSLDYASLMRAVDTHAAELQAQGVGPTTRVGICLDRSELLPVWLLAIRATGAAYVPLDPTFPVARLGAMLVDSGAQLLVTSQALVESLQLPAAAILTIDTPASATVQIETVERRPDTDELAYVIYTSGSTGKPKGVKIPERAVVSFLAGVGQRLGIKPRQRLLALTTISFDISVLELFLPLVSGGEVVVAPRATGQDGRELAIALAGIDIFQATPATWRMLLDADFVPPTSLMMLCGGEALPRDLAADLHASGGELWNLYGPTEATVWSTADQVSDVVGPISIGRALPNQRVVIRDDEGQPVPRGIVGELWIHGEGVGLGYHDRPTLTQTRFPKDPDHPSGSASCYRTGDLARELHDGRLLCLGRSDDQVKLRGFRIELGEIEARMRAHASVAQAAAAVHGEGIHARLIGYVVKDPTQESLDADALRRDLSVSLPTHMLPTLIIELAALPHTRNDKLDRRSLPPPPDSASRNAPTEAPHNDLELRLRAIWINLLGIDQIGVTEDFFELGGNSLLSVRMLTLVEERLGKRIDLPTLFAAPTIRDLADAVQQGGRPLGSAVLTLRRGKPELPLFCIRGIYLYQELAAALPEHLTTYAVFLDLEVEAMQTGKVKKLSVESMAKQYVRSIRETVPNGPYRLLGASFGGVLALEIAQQLQRLGETVELLVIIDAALPAPLPMRFAREVTRRYRSLKRRCASGIRSALRNRASDAEAKKEQIEAAALLVRKKIYRHAMKLYRPKPYTGDALLIQRSNDSFKGRLTTNSDNEWRKVICGRFTSEQFRCKHMDFLRPPLVTEITNIIHRSFIKAARPPATPID